jgi:hypothetical protein
VLVGVANFDSRPSVWIRLSRARLEAVAAWQLSSNYHTQVTTGKRPLRVSPDETAICPFQGDTRWHCFPGQDRPRLRSTHTPRPAAHPPCTRRVRLRCARRASGTPTGDHRDPAGLRSSLCHVVFCDLRFVASGCFGGSRTPSVLHTTAEVVARSAFVIVALRVPKARVHSSRRGVPPRKCAAWRPCFCARAPSMRSRDFRVSLRAC